jgi:CheY-like chemotaxis protein
MRALVVDDDDAFRTLVVALLAEVADVVEQAADGDVAVDHVLLDHDAIGRRFTVAAIIAVLLLCAFRLSRRAIRRA